MSNTRSEVFHLLLWPLALVVGLTVSGYLGTMEEPTFFAAVVGATVAHVHYGVCVVSVLLPLIFTFFRILVIFLSVENKNDKEYLLYCGNYSPGITSLKATTTWVQWWLVRF